MIHFRRRRPAGEGVPQRLGRRAGAGAGSPGPACRVLAGSFLRRRPSPASGALFCCPPGPPPRPTCFGFEPRFSPLLPLCPVPAQPGAASPPAFVLPGILTPRSAIMGSRRMTGPLGLQPCRLPPAGWPLSHRFHRSRFRFPAPLPSLPSLILVRVQLAQGTTAKPAGSPCLHLCALVAKLRPPPFWSQGFGAPLPPDLCWVGWESRFW